MGRCSHLIVHCASLWKRPTQLTVYTINSAPKQAYSFYDFVEVIIIVSYIQAFLLEHSYFLIGIFPNAWSLNYITEAVLEK